MLVAHFATPTGCSMAIGSSAADDGEFVGYFHVLVDHFVLLSGRSVVFGSSAPDGGFWLLDYAPDLLHHSHHSQLVGQSQLLAVLNLGLRYPFHYLHPCTQTYPTLPGTTGAPPVLVAPVVSVPYYHALIQFYATRG